MSSVLDLFVFQKHILTLIFAYTYKYHWLRHRDTSQTVAGSITDGVIGIFH